MLYAWNADGANVPHLWLDHAAPGLPVCEPGISDCGSWGERQTVKILDDGTRVGESTEERRRLRQAGQNLLDDWEYRFLVGNWRPGDVEPIGILNYHALDSPIPFVDEHGPGVISGYSSCVVYDPDNPSQSP